MRLTYGCTRWVILTDRYAIKIARFRPFRPFIRLFELLQKGGVEQNLKKHDENPVKAVLKYICAGVRANRMEYRLYKKYGDEMLVPTLLTIGWLINIQKRGEPSSEEDMQRHRLWSLLQGMGTPLAEDILQAKQFCMIGTRVCLADYGNVLLEPVLAAYERK
ncbi:MAG: hypothetical protein Q8L52_01930 [bacterium]|nr:hypothetical protein [bacterium]